jgi:prolycopene isomerase
VVQEGTECHHIVVEDWAKMENPRGCLFVSIPSILDESLAPKGHHTFHAFAPEFIVEYQGLSAKEYQALKEKHADEIIDHLEAAAFPGLRDAIVFREVSFLCFFCPSLANY